MAVQVLKPWGIRVGPREIGRQRPSKRANKGTVTISCEDRAVRPRIAQIGIRDDRHQRSTGTNPCPVPDLSFPRGNGDRGIHLPVNHLLPSPRVVGAGRVSSLELEELELTIGIGLKVDFREGHVDLLKFPLVRGKSIERITYHDEAGKPPLNLILGNVIGMGVVPIQPNAVEVFQDREIHKIHRKRGIQNIDIITRTEIRGV